MEHLHTAIQIRKKSEVEDFYELILGFERQYDFKLNNRKEVIAKSHKAGYEVIEVARNNGAVYFIKDFSGNMFEIK